MLKPSAALACRASILAAQLGQEIDEPAGSLWYPGFASGIQRELDVGRPIDQIEAERRIELGLKPAS